MFIYFRLSLYTSTMAILTRNIPQLVNILPIYCHKMKLLNWSGCNMVSIRYKSFFLGILLTSITWMVILFLSPKLNKNKIFSEFPSEKTTKWKLRPRIDNMHRIAQVEPNALESKEQRIKYNFIPKTKKLVFPDRETNLIEGNDLDYRSVLMQKTARYSLISDNDKDKVLNSSYLVHLGMINSPQDQRTKDGGYKRHAFNLLISDRLGFRRVIPYTAHTL